MRTPKLQNSGETCATCPWSALLVIAVYSPRCRRYPNLTNPVPDQWPKDVKSSFGREIDRQKPSMLPDVVEHENRITLEVSRLDETPKLWLRYAVLGAIDEDEVRPLDQEAILFENRRL
jgi:hypothetical protein